MKLSIVIPAYNEELRLKQCIKYLERQTVKPEVIFVDGGSKDNTVKLIKEAMQKNKNFRLAFEKGNKRSVANASNVGWSMAKGEAILITGVDTAIEPKFTEKVVREFEKRPKANLIRFVSKPLPPKKFKSLIEKAMFYKDERGEGKLLLFRTRISKTSGMYDPGLGFGDDKNFWRKVLSREKIVDVNTTVKYSKSATLDLKGIAMRYLWYGRTIPKYLETNKDNRTMLRAALAILFVISTLFCWVYPYVTPLFVFLLLLPLVRGLAFGLRLYSLFGVKSPILVLPFTEVLGFFFVGVGFFKHLLGDRTIGR